MIVQFQKGFEPKRRKTSRHTLSGVEGLAAAVVAQAVADLAHPAHQGDALQFFGSPFYAEIVTTFGYPAETLPPGLERVPGNERWS